MTKFAAEPQVTFQEETPRDPEDRLVALAPESIRDKMLDKTIADSFPTSDPPSSLPDPCTEDSFATREEKLLERQIGLDSGKPGKAA
ncbi:MAG TPA: hypothetical protein VFI82_09125 [Terriglobales bacterium]|jgi:hypothetical protein|nr:hypothetical protein [Terriglobales bacterium]